MRFQNTNAFAQLDIFRNQYMEALIVESRLESQIAELNELKLSEEAKTLSNKRTRKYYCDTKANF